MSTSKGECNLEALKNLQVLYSNLHEKYYMLIIYVQKFQTNSGQFDFILPQGLTRFAYKNPVGRDNYSAFCTFLRVLVFGIFKSESKVQSVRNSSFSPSTYSLFALDHGTLSRGQNMLDIALWRFKVMFSCNEM